MTTDPGIRRIADALEPAARTELLRVLTSPSGVRADVIRQFSERPGGQDMAELLIYLEEWEWARQAMIEELRELGRPDGRGEGSEISKHG